MAQLLPRPTPGIKRKRRCPGRVCTVLLAALLSSAAWAEEPRTFLVQEVLSGDRLRSEDGTEAHLSHIAAPAPPLDRSEAADWGPAADSAGYLASLVEGQAVALHAVDGGRDRYDRVSGLAYLADGRLLQVAMLRAGQARILLLPADEALAQALLSAEREARQGRLGLWRHPRYRIRPAWPSRIERDRFQVVIGEIVSANRVRRGAYLNFGHHWKSDVTVKLDRQAADNLEVVAGEIAGLAGRRVLLRGWVREQDGPLIEITDHRLIELID